MKPHEFDRLVAKLELKTRDTGDRHAWFEYEGKIITRTKCSHGRGFDLPVHLIRKQLKLNETQLRGLVKCTFQKDDYVALLRLKGLLPSNKQT